MKSLSVVTGLDYWYWTSLVPTQIYDEATRGIKCLVNRVDVLSQENVTVVGRVKCQLSVAPISRTSVCRQECRCTILLENKIKNIDNNTYKRYKWDNSLKRQQFQNTT